jgi:hypothetical protein
MLNNYLEQEYQPSHQVYCHASGNHLLLGDISAALDLNGLRSQGVRTGRVDGTQL